MHLMLSLMAVCLQCVSFLATLAVHFAQLFWFKSIDESVLDNMICGHRRLSFSILWSDPSIFLVAIVGQKNMTNESFTREQKYTLLK